MTLRRPAGRARVLAVAGLPGCGKTTLLRELEASGYRIFDDIHARFASRTERARRAARAGQRVAVSDVEFCDPERRAALERALRLPVDWVLFENAPELCAANCRHRHAHEQPDRPLALELAKIRRLSAVYAPGPDARPVVAAGGEGPRLSRA